jgi:uncharacterized membrane protein
MDKIFVIVFNNESKAYEGSRALQDLHEEGSLTLYAKSVIAKDASGKVSVKQIVEPGPVGTGVGLLTGSLLGLLGGPVGFVVGASAGMFSGLVYDLANLGVSEDFLSEAGQYLLPGKAAVVAEAWEEWVLPVDTRMQAIGGVVFRRTRWDILDAQIERDVAALNTELDELEAEYKQATGEAKAKLQAKIEAAKAKMQAMGDNIKAKIEASQKETDAKIKALQAQAAKAQGERKAKIEARIAELKADQKRRSELLSQAWDLTKEAMKV